MYWNNWNTGKLNERLKYLGKASEILDAHFLNWDKRDAIDTNPLGKPKYSDYLKYVMKIESESDLRGAIQAGRSETLEVVSDISEPRKLALLISAFANISGGTIIIGVSELGVVRGVDRGKLTELYKDAKKLLDNNASSLYFIQQKRQLFIAVISVTFSNRRIVSLSKNGIAYERRNTDVLPLTADRISKNLKRVLPFPTNEIHEHFDSISQKIEDLTKRVIERDSWKRKIRDMLLTGMIGAILSLILTVLLKI